MDDPTTQTDAQDASHALDHALVMASLESQVARDRLIERMRCVPRILAAKNTQLGGPLDHSELEDLAQETIMTVWSRRAEFEGRSALETWVFPFCYHALMNRVRARARGPRLVAVDGMDPADELPATQDYSEVHNALDELEPEEQSLLRLKHFEDLSFTEISNRTGVSPSTLKARYYRIITRLRTRLSSEEQVDP